VLGVGSGGGGTVATPTFSPVAGSYASAQTVTITCSTGASSIYFTTDGTTPTFPITGTTTLYTGPLTVSATETIKAIGVATGLTNSPVGSASYVISGGVTFAHFISTTGSDSNVGSLASPWAITAINTKQSTYAGTNLGIMPGIYDVSLLMQAAGYEGAVLQIQGGPNSSTLTYIGTCDSSGNYQAGTATLDAFGSVGQYGGGNTTHTPYILGQTVHGTGTGPQPTNWGNWIVDGFIFIGFSNWAMSIGGGVDITPSTASNCTIINCTFANGLTSAVGTHPAALILYQYNNVLVSNCLFYNNGSTQTDNTHSGASITGEGFGSGGSSGLTIEFCSFIKSQGNYVFQDNGNASNTTTRYCYFDFTPATNVANVYAAEGMTNPSTGLSGSSFHHNIIVQGGVIDNVGFQASDTGSPYSAYNNTWIRGADNNLGIRLVTTGVAGLITAYNNLMYDNDDTTGTTYGYMAASSNGFALCDYNIYGSNMSGTQFTTFSASGGQGGQVSQTFTSWKSAIGGLEAHSTINNTNPFTSGGTTFPSLAYQVVSGSPAFQTGHVGGVSGGTLCNVGAWDGTVTQIGSNLPIPGTTP